MAYADVTVVWEGAVDETATFTTDAQVQKFADQVLSDATTKKAEVKIFVLWHNHAEDMDCECVQFVQDGRPTYSHDPENADA